MGKPGERISAPVCDVSRGRFLPEVNALFPRKVPFAQDKCQEEVTAHFVSPNIMQQNMFLESSRQDYQGEKSRSNQKKVLIQEKETEHETRSELIVSL